MIARSVDAVRHLVASAPDHVAAGLELGAIGRVRGQDAVLPVKQDVRFGQALQIGNQFGQRLHS